MVHSGKKRDSTLRPTHRRHDMGQTPPPPPDTAAGAAEPTVSRRSFRTRRRAHSRAGPGPEGASVPGHDAARHDQVDLLGEQRRSPEDLDRRAPLSRSRLFHGTQYRRRAHHGHPHYGEVELDEDEGVHVDGGQPRDSRVEGFEQKSVREGSTAEAEERADRQSEPSIKNTCTSILVEEEKGDSETQDCKNYNKSVHERFNCSCSRLIRVNLPAFCRGL